MSYLSDGELLGLIRKVFRPGSGDSSISLFVDLPNATVSDTKQWRERRLLASEWLEQLQKIRGALGIRNVELICFENVGSNNADLPANAYNWRGDIGSLTSGRLIKEVDKRSLEQHLKNTDIVIAMTQFSATAPMKKMAKEFGFRAASMPGFTLDMIPALGIDYDEVHKSVMQIKMRLDEAESIEIRFVVGDEHHDLFVDSRFRKGHASSGLSRERGVTWNLPSGEAFIVPYEGEREESSRTAGVLPVQFQDEIVLYSIAGNRAAEILSTGKFAAIEQDKLRREPAYGNISEIGFGVLAAFGIKPVGVILLDEKLGLHIAFGRSDHFGGSVSPQDFKDPKNVVHIDRVYLPEIQSKISIESVIFNYPGKAAEKIIENDSYVI